MSLTGNSIQSTSLVNPGQQNESLGLNTVDPADTAGWVAGHLYWEYNPFLGNVPTSLELLVGRRDIQSGLANNDTQSVFTCMRDQGTGHLGTYTGDANSYGIGMPEADALGAAWADLRMVETSGLSPKLDAWGSYTQVSLAGYGTYMTNPDTGTWSGALSSESKATGKWYWEVVPNNNANLTIGLTAGRPASPYSVSSDSYLYLQGSVSQTKDAANRWGDLPGVAAGSVIGLALDISANTLKIYKNNTLIATVYPALQSGPFTPFVGSIGGSSATGYFNSNGFTYAPPAGYLPFGGSSTQLASRQCTLRLGGCLPNQAGSRSVLGPLLDTTNLAADDPNHIVVTVDPVDASNSTVTVYHNGVPGTPEVVSSSVFYGNTGSTLFGAVLGGTASPLNGYYFDNIAHYPLVLTSLQVATHYSVLANGGTVAVEGIREFQFVFSSADITHFEFYGVTLKTATGDDVLAGATQTVPVGSINYATMNPVSTGPASDHAGDYIVSFRTTADITAADLASYTIGSGTRYAYPAAAEPAVDWVLRYKDATGAWVTLDTRTGETWPYIQTREFSIGGGSSTVNPAQFGFNFTGVPAPVVEIGTDGNQFDTGSLAPVVEFSTVGVPLKQQHTSGKWYFEVDMSDVVCDGSWLHPGLVSIGVEEKIGNQQGAMVALSLQFDADGMVEKMIFWKKLKNASPASWELSVARGEIPAYSMTSPQRVISVFVDIGVSLPNKVRVAFGDKIGTSDGYWFDAMSGTFVPEGSTQLPVYWADQIPLQGTWTAYVNIRNVKAKVRVLTGESAPRISFDPGMKGWGLAS